MELAEGTLLQGGKYRLEKVLGSGGFGITYLAEQVNLGRKVAIKEFFFKQRCIRDAFTAQVKPANASCEDEVRRFLMKFQKEARIISQLKHHSIIGIHDIFEENNTAYYVMDYIDGYSLSEILKQQGVLPEMLALHYIQKIAVAIKYIHAKSINHLDVKPSNVMVRSKDNEIVLIDFGLSKQYDATGSQTSSTPLGISQGYAPIEQYERGGVSSFSPQTDIYSLGATLYALLTGTTPPAAHSVLNTGLPQLSSAISKDTRAAIECAMQPRKIDRPENIDAFLSCLPIHMLASPEDEDATQIIGVVPSETVASSRTKKIAIVAVAFVCMFVLAFCFMPSLRALFNHGIDSEGETVDSVAAISAEVDSVQVADSPDEKGVTANTAKKEAPTINKKTQDDSQEKRSLTTHDSHANENGSSRSHTDGMQISNGFYYGDLRNGKPHGKGKLTFSTDAVISSYDVNGTCAHAGESVEGNFENGVFYRGIYHSQSGDIKLNFGSHGND